MHIPPGVTVLLLVALTGCAASGPVVPEWGLRAGQAGLLNAPAALTAAGDAFMGPAGGGTGGGTGGLPGLDGNLLDSDSPTTMRMRRSRQAGVSAGLRKPLGPAGPGGGQASVSAVLRLESGSAAWHLPKGLGLLVDPMDIRIASRVVAPELRLNWTRPLAAGWQGDLSAGAGVMLVESRTRVRSALVALDNRSHQRLPYVTFGAAIGRELAGGGRAGLGLGLTAARPGGVQARLTADLTR